MTSEPGRFAFIINPSDKQDVARKYPIAKIFLNDWVAKIIKGMQPKVVSHISGIEARDGKTAEGWLIALPRFPEQLNVVGEDLNKVYCELCECAKIAYDLGATVLGLGGFTAVAGDKGITLTRMLAQSKIPLSVTTGNAYTAYLAVEAALRAAEDIWIGVPKVAVVGATGSVGSACARLLIEERVTRLTLVGKDGEKTKNLADRLKEEYEGKNTDIKYGTDIRYAVEHSNIILTVSSATKSLIDASWPYRGSVVCDVARPRNTSKVLAKRNDILVIDGGIVRVPGDVDFGFNFGLPKGLAFGCMAETIALSLNKEVGHHVGLELDVEYAKWIAKTAERQGFVLVGCRCFDKPVSRTKIEEIQRIISGEVKR